MPKMKTNRSAAKRFRRTKSGLYKRGRAYSSHMFTCKTTKRKRHLRRSALVSPADMRRIRTMLPYG